MHSRFNTPSRSLRVLVPTALAASIAFLPGCYKRVVHADGIGAEGIEVKQSNRSNSALDRAVFGDDSPGKNRANRPAGFTPKD